MRNKISMEFEIKGNLSKDAIMAAIKMAINSISGSLIHNNLDDKLPPTEDIIIKIDDVRSDYTIGEITILTSADILRMALIIHLIENLKAVESFQSKFQLQRIENMQDANQIDTYDPRSINQVRNDADSKTRSTFVKTKQKQSLKLEYDDSFTSSKLKSALRDILNISKPEFLIFLALVLIIASIALLSLHQEYTETVMIAVYFLLVIGVTWRLVQYLR